MIRKTFIFISLSIYIHSNGQYLDIDHQRYIGIDSQFHYFFQYGKRSGLVKPALLKQKLNTDNTFELIEIRKWQNIAETGFFVIRNSFIDIYYHRSLLCSSNKCNF